MVSNREKFEVLRRTVNVLVVKGYEAEEKECVKSRDPLQLNETLETVKLSELPADLKEIKLNFHNKNVLLVVDIPFNYKLFV